MRVKGYSPAFSAFGWLNKDGHFRVCFFVCFERVDLCFSIFDLRFGIESGRISRADWQPAMQETRPSFARSASTVAGAMVDKMVDRSEGRLSVLRELEQGHA